MKRWVGHGASLICETVIQRSSAAKDYECLAEHLVRF